MGKVPAGAELVVVMVSVEEQLGPQAVVESDELAPLGSPETERETCWPLPDLSVALIVFCTGAPFLTVLFPEFESEKSNESMLNQALASELGPRLLFLKPFAFTTVVLVTVKGSLYKVEDWLGDVPSVV
jgi:hypothetical protein